MADHVAAFGEGGAPSTKAAAKAAAVADAVEKAAGDPFALADALIPRNDF